MGQHTVGLVIAAAFSLCTSQVAIAQKEPLSLEILTEQVREAGTKCGITEELQKSALRAAMRYNRIPEIEPDSVENAPFVYSNVNTLWFVNGCVSNVRIEIKKYTWGPNGYGYSISEDVFCSKETMMSGSQSSHSSEVGASIKELFESCLSQMQEHVRKR